MDAREELMKRGLTRSKEHPNQNGIPKPPMTPSGSRGVGQMTVADRPRAALKLCHRLRPFDSAVDLLSAPKA
jgi:hypothetical protein